MSLNVALQMDHPSNLSPQGDSTIIIGLEAIERGHAFFYYHPSSLQMHNNHVYAEVSSLTLRDPLTHEAWYELGTPKITDLSTLDVIHMRQDPPFDMTYITATHMLERIHPNTLVVNHPFHVRNLPEKIFPFEFADYMPETLITSSTQAVEIFLEEHKDIIIKPLYGYGGMGIFRLKQGGDNIDALLEFMNMQSSEPFIAQRFLPEVSDGDRRIILIDGKVEGVLGRIPAEGEIRANLRVGGTGISAELSEKQLEICTVIGAICKERGLLFVGLDLIGDYLTEINITSPTGLRSVKDLYGTSPEATLWDAIEAQLCG